uniref:DNA polymerase III subunit delta' n=1 Tax=Thermogemmatispora argillosa TaxID=2045280 RepID=A0A455T799_9CHLR|nr:DNA polymerase III subunit delta' [Thermogemmatispora argillosa]
MTVTALEAAAHGWGIIGHEHALERLRRALASQQVRHAYLFTGPDQIGKTLLAQRFAQALLCTGGPDPQQAPVNPCHRCLACRKVLHGNHPDVHVISRPPDKQFILIDQIRALQAEAARHALEGRYKIFIIVGAHEMNPQAANCLLKTLEEPEPGVVLLLTAPERGLLLPTILSRVQHIPLHLLSSAQIREALETYWEVEAEEAELIAALASGRMGWAVRAVEDEQLLIERREQLELLARLPGQGRTERFAVAQRLSAEPERLRQVLELWLLWWRDLLLLANGGQDLIVNVDMRELLQQQAERLGAAGARRMIYAILRTLEALDQNVNPRAALEVLMLDLPVLSRA